MILSSVVSVYTTLRTNTEAEEKIKRMLFLIFRKFTNSFSSVSL